MDVEILLPVMTISDDFAAFIPTPLSEVRLFPETAKPERLLDWYTHAPA